MTDPVYYFSISARKNGGGDDQDLVWEYINLNIDGVVHVDGSATLFHILQGIGNGYQRGQFAGSGLAFLENPTGDANVVVQPPADPQPVATVNLIAHQYHQVANGMMVLEDDDFVEFASQDVPDGGLKVNSLKLVRVGIGNFL